MRKDGPLRLDVNHHCPHSVYRRDPIPALVHGRPGDLENPLGVGREFREDWLPRSRLDGAHHPRDEFGVVPHLRSDPLDVRTAQVQLIAREVLTVDCPDDLGELGGTPPENGDDDGGGGGVAPLQRVEALREARRVRIRETNGVDRARIKGHDSRVRVPLLGFRPMDLETAPPAPASIAERRDSTDSPATPDARSVGFANLRPASPTERSISLKLVLVAPPRRFKSGTTSQRS